MKFFCICSVLLLYSQLVFSQTGGNNGDPLIPQNTITTAVPFLNIPINARAAGMGDAGIASLADANGLQWNTAKLAFSDKKAEFSGSISDWLPQAENSFLAELSAYTKLGERHSIGGSMRYFSIGSYSVQAAPGAIVQEFKANEFAITGAYAFKISEQHAIGVNLKYIFSDLTAGASTGPIELSPGESMASDISYSYSNQELQLAGKKAIFSLGAAISNIGNKMTYSDAANRDFIPTNLGIGTGLKIDFNDQHSLMGTVDFNKLLVPTSPIFNNNGEVLSGKDNDVGVLVGMIHSFYDAPGEVTIGNSGQAIVGKGSRLKEELNEITIGGGFEYLFKDFLALRSGYFYEHNSKGNRKFITLGAGINYKNIGFNFSYLVAMRRTNPLNGTMRFSVNFHLINKKKVKQSVSAN